MWYYRLGARRSGRQKSFTGFRGRKYVKRGKNEVSRCGTAKWPNNKRRGRFIVKPVRCPIHLSEASIEGKLREARLLNR